MRRHDMETVKIVAFEQKHAADFKRLNMEWLQGYGLFEPADLKHLDFPSQNILDKGGRILMALEGDRIVGCCAVIVKDRQAVELAKFAVSKDSQGRGIGK